MAALHVTLYDSLHTFPAKKYSTALYHTTFPVAVHAVFYILPHGVSCSTSSAYLV